MPVMRDQMGIPSSTYTPPSGSAVTGITVRVQRNEAMETDRADKTQAQIQSAAVIVLQADLPSPPTIGGRFSVAGLAGVETWTVLNIPLAENGQLICACKLTSTERLTPRRSRD